jgi:hypothetical protein
LWGRQFIVDYNDGSQEIYSCIYNDAIGDCDYYLTLPEGDPEGTAYGEPANFWNTAANGDVFSKTNKTALLYMNLFFTLGEGEDMQYYFIQKACDETIEVETGAAEVYIEVRGSKTKYYTEYTGKPFKITKSKLDIWTSNYIDPKITKISPASVTAIGSHKITFTIDNSEGIYGEGKTKKVYSYFNVFPKKVTNAKASNPAKNKLKLTWTYELKSKSASKASKDAYKANYKKIDGYLVEIYDSTYNLIASKKYSKAYKNQKSVTIKSNKLKKGKTYYAFIFAYKNVKGNPFRSEAVIKKIKIKKIVM